MSILSKNEILRTKRVFGVILLLSVVSAALAQPVLSPQAVEQFQHIVGNRIETAVILGGDYGASGGAYTFRSDQAAEVSITKLGGGGVLGKPRALGIGQLKWAPVVMGNLGYVTARNEFKQGYLQGNKLATDLLALELGGGVRFYFTEHLSLASTVCGIYGRTKNEFTALNPMGDMVKAAASGTYVDWTLETWTLVPSLDLKYQWLWRDIAFAYTARSTYYHTESIASTSAVVGASGDSHTWLNRIEADMPLNWKLFDRDMRTGGYIARTEMGGNAAKGFNENHFYTVNGRLVLDVSKTYRYVRWVGLGASYFFSNNFNGWSAGLTMQLQY